MPNQLMETTAGYVRAPFEIELRDVLLERPGPSEALLEVTACGVCGTDVHWASSRATNWQPFGHEISATVAELGSQVTWLSVGDRVAVESSSACGRCRRCRDGHPHLCVSGSPLGGRGSLGFAEHLVVPGQSLVPAPDLHPHAVSIAEPLGVALDAVHTSQVDPDATALVVGVGPIALMAVRLLRHRGVRRLVVRCRDPRSARGALASVWGADEVVGPEEDYGDLGRRHGGFDSVIVTAPPSVVSAAWNACGVGGVVTYLGLDGRVGESITLDADAFHFRKLQLRASHASPGLRLPTALELLRDGTVPWRQLVSHVYPLEHLEDALRAAADHGPDVIKILVTARGLEEVARP